MTPGPYRNSPGGERRVALITRWRARAAELTSRAELPPKLEQGSTFGAVLASGVGGLVVALSMKHEAAILEQCAVDLEAIEHEGS